MADFFALPAVAQRVVSKGPQSPQLLTNVPVTTRKNVYVHPWHLDMSESAKYGLGGKYPSSVAIKAHFPSIVTKGLESEKEALEIKFAQDLYMTGKALPLFSVQYIDGHAKAIMVLAVFALLDFLVSCHNSCLFGMFVLLLDELITMMMFLSAEGVAPQDIENDEEMLDLIASLKFIRVNYVHFSSPELAMYEALSLTLRSMYCQPS